MTQRPSIPGDINDFKRALLRSARLDSAKAPASLRRQVLLATGAVGGAIATGASTAAGLAGAGHQLATTAVGAGAIAKWVGAGALVSAVAIGTVHTVLVRGNTTGSLATRPSADAIANRGGARSNDPRAGVAPFNDPDAAGDPAEQTETSLSTLAQSDDPGPTADVPKPSAGSAPAGIPYAARSTERDTAGSLRAELLALEHVRDAMAAANPGEALRRLDEYRKAFPAGILRPEATSLRIHALVRSGEWTTALALARKFLAENPKSPHVGPIRALFLPSELAGLDAVPPASGEDAASR